MARRRGSRRREAETNSMATSTTKEEETKEEEGATMSVGEAASAANSSDGGVALAGLRQLRLILSAQLPPIDEVIKTGVVPRLIQFLSLGGSDPKFQLEALWALTNITSGNTTQTEEVIKCGIVPPAIALLSSPDVDVCKQATWALGNICGDSVPYRDYVLQLGFFPAWAFSNGCRGKPVPDVSYFQSIAGESISMLFSTLSKILLYNDLDVISSSVWAVSYLASSAPYVSLIISSGIIPLIIPFLQVNRTEVQVPILSILGDIAYGSQAESQSLIDAGIFRAVTPLLQGGAKSNLQKTVCLLLSNIAAGASSRQQEALFMSGVIPLVARILSSSVDTDIRKEACWVVCNSMQTENLVHIDQIISLEVLEPMATLMDLGLELKLIVAILESMKKILARNKGEIRKYWTETVASAVGRMQRHSDSGIRGLVASLLEQYEPNFLQNRNENTPQVNNNLEERRPSKNALHPSALSGTDEEMDTDEE
ncbi:importin subunit alpha-1 [Pelomyxa schiedti]|nr:importin subunit alpha-1 [Pelomyxa schiedti]